MIRLIRMTLLSITVGVGTNLEVFYPHYDDFSEEVPPIGSSVPTCQLIFLHRCLMDEVIK